MDLDLRWENRITAALGALEVSYFVVAVDVWRQEGAKFVPSKRFRTFPSAEVFFREYLPWHAKRCYYEIMPADKPVKVYFDIEWISAGQEDGKLPGIIYALEEAICERWPAVQAQRLCDGWGSGACEEASGTMRMRMASAAVGVQGLILVRA